MFHEKLLKPYVLSLLIVYRAFLIWLERPQEVCPATPDFWGIEVKPLYMERSYGGVDMAFDLSLNKVIEKYPRIVAHLIAESYGYFTPISAANAIKRAKLNEPCFCEWYCDCARRYGDRYDEDNVRRVTKEILNQTIQNRHYQKGSWADYRSARRIVDRAITGEHPVFASWF